jgi:hypothetical protein
MLTRQQFLYNFAKEKRGKLLEDAYSYCVDAMMSGTLSVNVEFFDGTLWFNVLWDFIQGTMSFSSFALQFWSTINVLRPCLKTVLWTTTMPWSMVKNKEHQEYFCSIMYMWEDLDAVESFLDRCRGFDVVWVSEEVARRKWMQSMRGAWIGAVAMQMQ